MPPPEARCPEGSVWKANMAVYGLADAPFEFYKSLDRFLRFHEVWEEQLQWVITQCEEDPCVYVVHDIQSAREAPVMVFATHVDDFLVCGPSEHIRNFHACVRAFFSKTTFETLPFQHCCGGVALCGGIGGGPKP